MKILKVQEDRQGRPVIIVGVTPDEMGMTVERLDLKARRIFAKADAMPGKCEWGRDEQGVLFIGCPECGMQLRLAKTHRIQDSGEVYPDCGCPKPGCTFQESMITLGGFEPIEGKCNTCGCEPHKGKHCAAGLVPCPTWRWPQAAETEEGTALLVKKGEKYGCQCEGECPKKPPCGCIDDGSPLEPLWRVREKDKPRVTVTGLRPGDEKIVGEEARRILQMVKGGKAGRA